MTRAAIVVVDDQPQELTRLGQEPRKRYGQDYEVVEASAGGEALEVLRSFQHSGRPRDALEANPVTPAHWRGMFTS